MSTSNQFSSPPEGSIRAAMHDINGQLFVLRASTEMLAATLPADSPARARIERILGACDKISEITGKVGARAREENL